MINGDAAGPLSEIKRLSERVFAVIDSDRDAPGANPPSSIRAFEAACQSLAIPVLIYERRTIENYLTGPAVQQIQGMAPLGPYERVPAGWSKARNWLVARDMTKVDFVSTDIGQFIQNTVLAT